MSLPKVSVVTPCYNGAEFIQKTLNSVFQQTYDNLQIIAIDDGSQDDTLEQLRAVDEDRLKILVNEENRGIPATRNRGVKHADGKYICFLDQDDYWFSPKIERQAKMMEEDKTIGVTYSDCYSIDEDGRPFELRKPGEPPENPAQSCYLSNFTTPFVTKMYRYDCFEKVGNFDENIYGADDHDFDVRVLAETDYQFHYIETPLAIKRQWGGNAGENFEQMMDDAMYLAVKHAEKFPDVVGQKKSWICAIRSMRYLQDGQRKNALRDAAAAIRYNPKNWQGYLYFLIGLLPAYPSIVGAVQAGLHRRSSRESWDD